MTRAPPRIGSTRLRLLGLLLRARDQGRTLTYRDLTAKLGITFNAVVEHLHGLRRAGLVVWEPHLARTLRPQCRFVPVAELELQNGRRT